MEEKITITKQELQDFVKSFRERFELFNGAIHNQIEKELAELLRGERRIKKPSCTRDTDAIG